MNVNIQVLDCTLRDGGLGLEDAEKNGIDNIKFSAEDRQGVTECLTQAGIDIIELGTIELTTDDRTGFAIYPNIESISKNMPVKEKENQIFTALYRGPDTPIEDIPEWNPTLCEGIRVIIRYSEIKKSLDFCAALCKKGYKVFIQPMLTMRYTEAEIDLLIYEANRMSAYALYFVDSYGYMQSADVLRLFEVYDNGLKPEIKIGFHAHNNMNLAFSNTLSLMNVQNQRGIIIDTCLWGMGQGAGNLQTELFLGYICQNSFVQYGFGEILDGCEIIERYDKANLWGYSVTRLIPALYKTAYKYSISLRKKYHMSYREINEVLAQIPEELKQRYTVENTIELLRVCGFEHQLENE